MSTVYVSPHGDDSIVERDNPDKPARTWHGALGVAQAGDLIRVAAGEYVNDRPLSLRANVNYAVDGIAKVQYIATSGGLFTDPAFPNVISAPDTEFSCVYPNASILEAVGESDGDLTFIFGSLLGEAIVVYLYGRTGNLTLSGKEIVTRNGNAAPIFFAGKGESKLSINGPSITQKTSGNGDAVLMAGPGNYLRLTTCVLLSTNTDTIGMDGGVLETEDCDIGCSGITGQNAITMRGGSINSIGGRVWSKSLKTCLFTNDASGQFSDVNFDNDASGGVALEVQDIAKAKLENKCSFKSADNGHDWIAGNLEYGPGTHYNKKKIIGGTPTHGKA